jgi:nucleolar complex protein 2
MAKKLGKKARKFARKHLQSAAKRNRKQRSQFARRPRRGGSGRGNERDGDGDDEMPQRAIDNVMNNGDAAALVNGLEFPEDECELNSDLSDSDGYLSEVCLLILFRGSYSLIHNQHSFHHKESCFFFKKCSQLSIFTVL